MIHFVGAGPGAPDLITLRGARLLEDPVAEDGSIITSRGVGTAIPFALALVRYLETDETANALAKAIVFA